MTCWNYRVIKKTQYNGDGNKNPEVIYQIHEIYYLEDGTIDCWSDNPVEPLGVSEKGLRNDIQSFLSAFRKPMLEVHYVNGKAALVEEKDYSHNPKLQDDYAEKASRASGYLNHILGSHLLLKQEPELRQAYEKVDQALSDLYNVADSKKVTVA